MQQGVQMDTTCNIPQCWELLANTVVSICTVLIKEKYSIPQVGIVSLRKQRIFRDSTGYPAN